MPSSIIFMDTETGGFDASRNAILTVAAVPIIGGQALIDHGITWKVRDLDGVVDPRALMVNGIKLEEHMAAAQSPAEVVRQFNGWASRWFSHNDWIQHAMHNAPFDVPFVGRLWRLAGSDPSKRFSVHQVCTMGHAKMLFMTGQRSFQSLKLPDVARAYGIPVDASVLHTSLGDAIIGAQILVKQMEELVQSHHALRAERQATEQHRANALTSPVPPRAQP